MKQSELKKMIKQGMLKSIKSINVLSDNDNPQVVEVKRAYQAQHDTLEAVYNALNNDTVFLRILIGD